MLRSAVSAVSKSSNVGRKAAFGFGVLAVGAAAAHTPTRENTKDILSAFPGIIKNDAIGPLNNGRRSQLDTFIQQYSPEAIKPFTAAVQGTNRSLDINTKAKLPKEKLESYKRDIKSVQDGSMSNTSAFSRSAAGWIKKGNYPAAFMNMGGAILSAFGEGVQEDIRRKTGRWE